ncbi:MAG: hypothetical protein A2X83_00395 [Desulfuromonadales bacterium GWD2_54_10]|nr:MAG: hypothetical protein A2X83_00395 [Desulfuromonadales bacterium GWD2_54_10]
MSEDRKLREILQGMPIPTFVIDHRHIVTHWNVACEHALGIAAHDMIGTSRQWEAFYADERPVMADLVLAEAPEEQLVQHYADRWCKSLHVEGGYEAEDYYPHIGEEGTWFFFTAAPLRNDQGQVTGAIETLQDITDRKRAEQELKKYQNHLEELVQQRTAELTEVNDELSKYAFVVSHDLRSPLRAIRNYADFLQEELGESLNDDQQLYFSGLRRALNHGEELVRDLLDFSHISKREIVSQRIDPGVFLRDLVHSKIIPPDVEVVLQDSWPLVAADRTLIEQIFRNLISNALKFNRSSDGRRVEFGWQPAGEGCCELFVRDNGIGIDPRYHDQVFQMLQRLHTQKEFEGTGIGLAIVRKSAQRLHGSVRLESMPGEGCTVFVLLPLWKPREVLDV